MNKEQAQNQTTDSLVLALNTSLDGLTITEASRRLSEHGQNVLKTAKQANTLSLIFKQFKNSLIYLLLAACIVSLLLKDWNDGIVIAVILALNTGLGFYQEFKSGKAIEKLQKLVGKQVLVDPIQQVESTIDNAEK